MFSIAVWFAMYPVWSSSCAPGYPVSAAWIGPRADPGARTRSTLSARTPLSAASVELLTR